MKKAVKKEAVKWLMAVVVLGAVAIVGALYQGSRSHTFASSAVQPTSLVSDAPLVMVYKNPTCSCCGEWAEHLEESGFRVEVKEADAGLMHLKSRNGISPDLASCHTAVVDDYVLEGHVPARQVHRLLRERPDIQGLAVPGMPAGTPGMPPAGPDRDPYEVLAIQQDGSTTVYATG